jgi:dihydroneopterin aldolase/2-amino-4-hydroxy-6-hydroxymethyldihydropteridine diphosphokinase
MSPTVTPYVKDGVELDQIAVTGVRVNGRHGVLESERETGQVFLADVVAHVSTRGAAARDDLTKTVNYSQIADSAAEILAGDPSQLLETVAEHIAKAVLDMDGVHCVDVVVHKPQAPLHVEFKDVQVRIRRDLRTGGLWADKRIGSSAGMSDDPLAPGSAGTSHDDFDTRPDQPVPALLALGGNVGNVEQTLERAVHDLHRVTGIEVRTTSPLVSTPPAGGPPQDHYLNAVVRIHTALAPRELLGACQGIEMVYGRERAEANGPRTIDIDVIAYGDVVGRSADLELPHPRAHLRNFVLAPWMAIEPDAVLPGPAGGRVTDLAGRVGAEGLEVVANPWPARGAADARGAAGA